MPHDFSACPVDPHVEVLRVFVHQPVLHAETNRVLRLFSQLPDNAFHKDAVNARLLAEQLAVHLHAVQIHSLAHWERGKSKGHWHIDYYVAISWDRRRRLET